jgi:hypothetical protein
MAHADLRALNRAHPRLGEVLWRTTLVDGAIYREWMVNVGQRDATSRMAHLFCETMLRAEAAGLGNGRHLPHARHPSRPQRDDGAVAGARQPHAEGSPRGGPSQLRQGRAHHP